MGRIFEITTPTKQQTRGEIFKGAFKKGLKTVGKAIASSPGISCSLLVKNNNKKAQRSTRVTGTLVRIPRGGLSARFPQWGRPAPVPFSSK